MRSAYRPPGLQRSHSFRASVGGFTLIELMVVIAIVAIVTTIAIPSWRNVMLSSNIRNAVSDFSLAAAFARSEAVRRNTPVIFCPSSNGTSCTSTDYQDGWIVKTGGTASASTDVILQDYPPVKMASIVTNKSSRITGISYLSNGMPIGNFRGFTISIQPLTGAEDYFNRYICVASTGRVRVLKEAEFMASSTCG